MIQKGIIEQVINKYTYRVRIPRYDKIAGDPSATKTKDLPIAIVCAYPGTELVFTTGDIVLVDYENDELNQPVILGLLYNEASSTKEDVAENINLPGLKSALAQYNSDIQALKDMGIYTYIRYSNDGGQTFTSLFEHERVVTNISTQEIALATYKVATDISIDPASSSIYWLITNNDGINVTDSFEITTTLHSSDTSSRTFKKSLIDVPLDMQNRSDLFLDFSLRLKDDNDDFNKNYHVILTTDKNKLGTAYGKYLGICISTSTTAPTSPNEYTWSSFETPMLELINVLEENWKPRLQRLEQTLFGHTYDDENAISDGSGITDILAITQERIDLHGSTNRDVSFNNEKSIFIDNSQTRIVTPETLFKSPTSATGFSEFQSTAGHLTLIKRT